MSKTLIMKTKCPECGARMNVDVQAETARCDYCGTTARIADKKKPKEVPKNPNQAPQPVIWVSTGTGSSMSWVWILSTLLPLAIFGFVYYNIYNNSPLGNLMGDGAGPGSGGSAGQSFGEHMQWVSHKSPMLVDLTGDGVMDVIGWVRFISMTGGPSYDRVAAFDPITGNRIWDTGPISDSGGTGQVHAALSGDKLLVADTTGMLKAFLLAGGTLAWQSVLGERAEKICAAENGFAAVFTADKRILKVPVATGQLTPAGQWEYDTPCPPLQNDGTEVGPYFVKTDISRIDWEEIQGMNTESVVTDLSTGKTLALGCRNPGTRSPMAAQFELTPGKKKQQPKVGWLSSVTSLNPLTVEEGAPDHGAAAVGRLVTSYEIRGPKDSARLSCLDENNGQILWDVPLPRSDAGSVDRITVSNHHVFVGHWTYLDIFQLVDGAHKMTIGVW